MRHYENLATYDRNGFTVIVDKTWEDIHPGDCFDDSCYDIQDMCRRIDSGDLDWFMLRVRVLIDDVELSSEYLGGCMYEDARDVLTDGTAEDLIYTAIEDAKTKARGISFKLWMMDMEEQGEAQ